jgi:hypothetical protein
MEQITAQMMELLPAKMVCNQKEIKANLKTQRYSFAPCIGFNQEKSDAEVRIRQNNRKPSWTQISKK